MSETSSTPRVAPRIVIRLFAFVLLGAVGLAAGFYLGDRFRADPSPNIEGLMWPNPKQVGPFTLHDQAGRPFGVEALRGRWTLMFFGYTHCPDVCPVTLSVLKQVDSDLASARGADASAADNLQYVFVSVDPDRDSPEHLGQYVEFFEPDFIGVTGSDEELTGLTRQLGVIYIRDDPDENGQYLVDHTAAVFLIDPQARLLSLFQAPHDSRAMVDRVAAILEWARG